MSRPAIADAGMVTPEADSHALQVSMAERLALGVEEAGTSEHAERPCGADRPRSATSVPVTRTEEDKVRVIDAVGLGHLRVPVTTVPDVGEVRA